MDVVHLRTDGNAVQTGQLLAEQAAFQTCVDDIDGSILARDLAVSAQIEITQGRNGCPIPTGIAAVMLTAESAQHGT